MRSMFAGAMAGIASVIFLTGGLTHSGNVSDPEIIRQSDIVASKAFTTEAAPSERTYTLDDLLGNIKDFVDTPEDGISWQAFGSTKQHDYAYKDSEDMEWSGVRPEFSEDLLALDGKEILIQGYMFPLEQEEKQSYFLLGPFPVSCPFHYHVTPNLVIEVHARTPVVFSYDPVNIKGKLELVPEDDEYNIFYRLKDATIQK